MTYKPPFNPLRHVPEIPVDTGVSTYTGFGMYFEPYEYSGWVDESMSWKESCYIGDWSPLLKYRVRGPDALQFFSDISVNSFAKYDIGQAKHIILCNRPGKVMGEGILMRLAEDDFLFTSVPGVLWAQYLFEKGHYDADAAYTGSQFIFQIQGPGSLHVLEKATGESLRDIGFMRFRNTRIRDMEFMILRQGMAGEIGFELHGPSEYAIDIYNILFETGKEFGIRRLGGRTKMVNHVEACFPTPSVDFVPAFFGEEEKEFMATTVNDFSPFFGEHVSHSAGSFEYDDISELYRTPVELGWIKNIKFDHDFIGRNALEREVASPARKMVTLVWNSEDVIDVYASLFRKEEPYQYMEMPRNLLGCMYVDKVLRGDRVVGITMSRCYSYYFRQMISLCTLDAELCEPGTEVTVMWGEPQGAQKHIRAVVAPAPYKRDNRRADLSSQPSFI